MFVPVIRLADVTMYGALDPDGEVYTKCRLTILGKPANVVLYRRLAGTDDWKVVDQLSQAHVTENANGSLTITGISHTLVAEVGVQPSDATVRWEVQPKGCPTCH